MNITKEIYEMATEIKLLVDAFLNLIDKEEYLEENNKDNIKAEVWQGNNVAVDDTMTAFKDLICKYTLSFTIKEVVSEYHRLRRTRIIDDIPESLRLILQHPNLFDLITKTEFDKKIVGELTTRQTIFLCACGGLVENANIASYNLMVNSESGAGKDFVTSRVLEILPPKKVVKRTRISPTAFTYWHNSAKDPAWTWNEKVCYLEDISSNVLNHEVFKVMCSGGSHATVVINQTAVDIEIKGKPVLLITTASATPQPEMLRRFTILNLDESKDQTKEVVKRQAELAEQGISPEYDPEITEALAKLKRVKVIVPFSKIITSYLPVDHVIMRTHFNRFMDLIKASAALYQFQRRVDESGFILAEGQDYDAARIALLKTTSNQYMIPLSKNQKEILNALKDLPKQQYTAKEIEPLVKCGNTWLYKQLDDLAGLGMLKKDKEIKREGSDRYVMTYSYLDVFSFDIPIFSELINKSCRNNENGKKSKISKISESGEIPKAISPIFAISRDFRPTGSANYHKCAICGTTPCYFEDEQGKPYCSKECMPRKRKEHAN